MLCYLLKNPDRVISRFEFIKNCWEGDIIVGENGERPPKFDVRWSPDSKWIQT